MAATQEDAEVNVMLDENGRLMFDGGSLSYSFRSFPEAIKDEEITKQIIEDCEITFTAKNQKSNKQYSEGQTFWVPASESPSTLLESVAQSIFFFHAKNAKFDKSRSGAEWWPLVMDLDDEVGFHWDKDYNLEDYDINVYPLIATVTYLSDLGAPTLILDRVAPTSTKEDITGPIPEGFLSRPRIGKHVCFDGRFLHCAPCELANLWKKEKTQTKKRVTFLVNVWLNHKPEDAVALPDSFKTQLKPAPSKLEINWKEEQPEVYSVDSKSQKEDMEWEMKASKKVSINVPIPTDTLHGMKTTSACLKWTEKDMANVSILKKKKKQRKKK